MFHRGKVINQIFKHPNFIQKSLDKLNEYCKKMATPSKCEKD